MLAHGVSGLQMHEDQLPLNSRRKECPVLLDYKVLFDQNPDGLLLVNAEHDRQRFRFIEVGQKLIDELAIDRGALVGRTPQDILPVDQALFLCEQYRRCLEMGARHETLLPFDGPWGRRTWQIRMRPLSLDNNNEYLLCSARDITASRDLSHQLDSIADYLPGFVYQLTYHPASDTWRYAYVGRRVKTMFGIDSDAVLEDASLLMSMIHPDDFQRVIDTSMHSAETLDPWHCEFRMVISDSQIIWLRSHDLPQKTTDGTVVWTGYAEDVTDFKRLEESLQQSESRFRHLAETDALTGLPNRASVMARLDWLITGSNKAHVGFAVCFIDLDNFKPVNDRFGHEAGDSLLIQVGSRLKSTLRVSDWVGRLGGDEFIAILNDPESAEQAAFIAKKLVAELSREFRIGQVSAKISASIGVSLFPDHGATPEDLMRSADRAMYQAKSEGRSRVCLADSTEVSIADAPTRLSR